MNERNAGRKRKFTDDEIKKILDYISSNRTIEEAAKKYHTSRQVIGRYINKREYTGSGIIRYKYMKGRKVITIIDVDFLHKKINIQNRTNNIYERAFCVLDNPNFEQFKNFLEWRCVPRTRYNIKEILQEMNIDSYDPVQIVEKTKGRISDDNFYLVRV